MYYIKKINYKSIIFVLLCIFLFFAFDIILRLKICELSISESFYNILAFDYDLLFIIVFLFVFFITYNFCSKKIAEIFLLFIFSFFYIIFIVNYLLITIKKVPLSIDILFFSDEGLNYLNFVFDKFDLTFFLISLFLLIIIIIIMFLYNSIPYKKASFTNSFIGLSILFLLFVFVLFMCKKDLYSITEYNYVSKKIYYDKYNSTVDSFAVLGFYEYIFRDSVLHLSNNYELNNYEYEINNFFSDLDRKDEKNDKTGIFKDKNLILIMMESIDNYVVNDRVTPNIMFLKNNGWNFTSRYSYLPSGGSTISTEFTSLNGLFLSGSNDFVFSNKYPQSIPNVFNNSGYNTISMHQNTCDFYDRCVLHSNEMFNNSYFLLDMDKNININDDLQLVNNDEYYNLIVPKDGNKFMSYIITMAAHGPYDDKNICNNHPTSKDCFEYLSSNTDAFIGRLIERLKEDNLFDDTVIVLYTDHQSFTFDYPKSYLKTLKNIDGNYNIKAIPFIIYSNDIKNENFDMLVNDIDLGPTIFNLFGIDYDHNHYLGVDVFSKDHRNLLMFSNNAWYDGKNYGSGLNFENYHYTYKILSISDYIIYDNYYEKNY